MADIRLTDLIDVSVLQEIQDGFADVTGMAALTTDADGNPLTQGSNFTDFCMKYTRQSRIGCERCAKCDRDGGEKTRKTGRAAAYVCHGGLMDFAAPIMVNGQFIGSFIGGQVLTEEPDENKFRRIAAEIGVDPDEYVAALRKVTIVPKERVESAAKFLHTIAKSISQIAFAKFEAQSNNKALTSDAVHMNEVIKKVETTADAYAKTIIAMENKFNELSKLAETCVTEINATNETIKLIQDIAMNTRILGYNASIEAARAKDSGKGFGVIAQEVRSLAETSRLSADKIESKMKTIHSCATEIEASTKAAETLVLESVHSVEELKKAVL